MKYYGIFAKTKVRESQHTGMSGEFGLWSVRVICSVKTEGGTEGIEGLCRGWVHLEAWSQADTGFVVAWQCHAVHAFKDTLLLSLMLMLSEVPHKFSTEVIDMNRG